MLHIFFGNGAIAVRKQAFAFVSELESKGFKLERIDADSFVEGICLDIAQSVSLFGDRTVYLIDTPSSNSLFNEEVLASLPQFKESANIFVVIEEGLLAAPKKTYGKYADFVEEVSTETQERYNAFSMADSLSRKDKKTLWLQLQEAKQSGLSAEEIIGTLWWQLKTLRLAKLTKSAAEAGMKDFPYTKAKRSLMNFNEGDLEKLSTSLLLLYHDGHLGKHDIDLSLEKWALTM